MISNKISVDQYCQPQDDPPPPPPQSQRSFNGTDTCTILGNVSVHPLNTDDEDQAEPDHPRRRQQRPRSLFCVSESGRIQPPKGRGSGTGSDRRQRQSVSGTVCDGRQRRHGWCLPRTTKKSASVKMLRLRSWQEKEEKKKNSISPSEDLRRQVRRRRRRKWTLKHRTNVL